MGREERPWKAFTLLFGLGAAGVLALLPLLLNILRRQIERRQGSEDAPPDVSEKPLPPLPILLLLSVVQSLLLLAGAVAAGLALAPRAGLRSHLVAWAERGRWSWTSLRQEIIPATATGLLSTLGLLLGERLFRPWTAETVDRLEAENPRTMGHTLAGLLYGGITAELLMRWGLQSALAWAGGRLFTGARDRVMWGAVAIPALLFGVGHLPALAAMAELTPALVARTVSLNAVGGLLYGRLYWRHSLEAAMIGHGSGHIFLTLWEKVRKGS